eukprot:GHVT01049872.1.p1 GENE.GHVT01049872.1~~GHVT01049872.1.p1  ORF type:complete len:414 (-),score=67.09 GHVT01049872.1:1797-3038(-)
MSGRPRDKISLLIRNLSFFTSPQAVREAFEVHGPVRDVYLPLDFFTKKPRGFGFVEYQNEEDSYRALREMDGVVIDNKRIEVTVAKKGRSDPNAMRHRGGDDYVGGGGRRGSRSRSGGRRRSRSASRGRYGDDRYGRGRHEGAGGGRYGGDDRGGGPRGGYGAGGEERGTRFGADRRYGGGERNEPERGYPPRGGYSPQGYASDRYDRFGARGGDDRDSRRGGGGGRYAGARAERYTPGRGEVYSDVRSSRYAERPGGFRQDRYTGGSGGRGGRGMGGSSYRGRGGFGGSEWQRETPPIAPAEDNGAGSSSRKDKGATEEEQTKSPLAQDSAPQLADEANHAESLAEGETDRGAPYYAENFQGEQPAQHPPGGPPSEANEYPHGDIVAEGEAAGCLVGYPVAEDRLPVGAPYG